MNIENLLKLNDKSGKIFKESYIKKYYKTLYLKIITYCEKYNLVDIPFKQKMYHYYHDIQNYSLCTCGDRLSFINFNSGYSKHCSQKCSHNDTEVIDKTKQTLISKYGVDNLQKSNIIRDKTYQTNINKLGVKHPAQNSEILDKMKKTTFKKLGVYYPSQDKSVRDKYYKTIIKKNIDKYDNLIDIDYNTKKMTFMCDCNKSHNFEISTDLFKNRKKAKLKLCTVCNTKFTSQSEADFLNIFKINYIHNDRKTISPLELDVHIPELKITFEFNGLYWHNEINKENDYHLNKTELCEKQNIQLIHIWEDDWNHKKDIVKSIISNKLGIIENKIYARKTEVREITDNNLVKCFLEINHLQGFIGSKIRIGLFYDNELVSLMTFGKRRIAMGKKTTNDDEYELLRFCNKLNTNVIGGASKLFKYFRNKYNPTEIITYADRSYSQGKVYEILGFDFVGKTNPNYYYIVDGIRKYRFNYRKDILVKQGFDINKSEHEIMLERKIYRIYDSGNLKFKYHKL